MNSLNLPLGFRFSGVACGIKASRKPDMSLVVGDHSLTAAGVYTRNQIVAAPVVLCRSRTPSSQIRAVVTNSGNANACTGQQGAQDADTMCRLVADQLGIDESQVLVMSTGVIGQPLPMDIVGKGIEAATSALGDAEADFLRAADAILTTDQGRKVVSCLLDVDGKPVRIAAMAKGAGMIAPNMATMLGVVLTDASISQDALQRLLTSAAEVSFNRVSVDGHTSTNDTVLALASGASGVEITSDRAAGFSQAVNSLCIDLARQLVADGEGATHVMKIAVVGAQSDADANRIAEVVGASPLVKTAITGGDPNWGRIVSAAGYAGCHIDPQKTSLAICETPIFRDGAPLEFNAAELSKTMKQTAEVEIDLTVGSGTGTAIRWASDLTVEYVRFNSEYTT